MGLWRQARTWFRSRGEVARTLRPVGLAAGVAFALSAAPALASEPPLEDFSGPAFMILPPGENGSLLEDTFSTDLGEKYNALTPKQGLVTQADIEKDFISEKFGVQGPMLREEITPRSPGLTIKRDQYDVPHIYGGTRSDVMYGSGWVDAEDRGLLIRRARGPAFVAALSVPGLSALGLLEEGRTFRPSKEAIEFVEAQKASLEEQGAEGAQVIEDLEAWLEGANAYEQTLPALLRIPHLDLANAMAAFAFIGDIFGNGGGGELADANLLANLQGELGSTQGMKVYRDLRETNDPEAPTTAAGTFPYEEEPTGPTPGTVAIKSGSESAAATASLRTLAKHKHMSNFLLVSAKLSKSGHPIGVAGPQVGYSYPALLDLKDLHGPGIDAEGAGVPVMPYVLLGRGRDFSWSLTSEGAQNTTSFLKELCSPDPEVEGPPTQYSKSYVYGGECIPMHEFDAGEVGASSSEKAHEVHFWETNQGPVHGTVQGADGKWYAIAEDRTTRGRDPASLTFFERMNSHTVSGPQTFYEAANKLETTFNIAYWDSANIAYFASGRLPKPAPGTNPSLPTLGNGEYNWQGFLGLDEHPHEANPLQGYFTSWNNKSAPGWGAASGEFSYGPIYRSQLFTGFGPETTQAKLVGIMNSAAQRDLDAFSVWPTIAKVLGASPAPSPLAARAARFINRWVRFGGSSRYGNEGPRSPAAAILDEAWTPIGEAVLGPVLGSVLDEFRSINEPVNAPSSLGSAYDGGWEGYVYKALREVLGESVQQPYTAGGYCGGNLTACRTALWAAIEGAVEKLSAEQGPNPWAWRAAKVSITFPPGLLFHNLKPYTMKWTNRSTFQQVVEYNGHS